jgi:hypothetical protein
LSRRYQEPLGHPRAQGGTVGSRLDGHLQSGQLGEQQRLVTARAGADAVERDFYQGAYGEHSEMAHLRMKGLRLKFDRSVTGLLATPDRNSDLCCRFVLVHALLAAWMMLIRIRNFNAEANVQDAWMESSS